MQNPAQFREAAIHPIGVTQLRAGEDGGAQERPQRHGSQPPDRQAQTTGGTGADHGPQAPLPFLQERSHHQGHVCPQKPIGKARPHDLLHSPVMAQGDLRALQTPVVCGCLADVGLGIRRTGEYAHGGHVLRLRLNLRQTAREAQEILHLIAQKPVAHAVAEAAIGAFQNAVQLGLKLLQ